LKLVAWGSYPRSGPQRLRPALPDHILQRVNPRIEAQLIPGPLAIATQRRP